MDHFGDFSEFLAAKQKAKQTLLESEKPFDTRAPLLVVDLEDGKLPYDFFSGLDRLGVRTVILAPKAPEVSYQHIEWYPENQKAEWFFAADFVLSLRPKTIEILHTGSVPIGPQEGYHSKPYSPLEEEGNGFFFDNGNKWEIFAAIIRALENYQFPYDWENLMRAVYRVAKSPAQIKTKL